MIHFKNVFTIFAILFLVAAQCSSPSTEPANHTPPHEMEMPEALSPVSLSNNEKLKVVATTSIVGDMIKNVGSEMIDLTVLLPLGSDPHAFEPTPRDLVKVADAHVIFVNGLGLEAFLTEMLENAGGEAPAIALSHGVEIREFGADEEHEHEGKAHEHEGTDPHTWMTPVNAIVFVDNIKQALSQLDPANAEAYETNATAYKVELQALDVWIETQIESIPPENRELVTDHDTFGYYADRYGLEMIGAVLPAYSTNAQPSAQELAVLQDAMNQYNVKAVFVGITINPALAERVAEDTGTKLVPLYTGSLGEPGSGAETYTDYIRYNTSAIVEALR